MSSGRHGVGARDVGRLVAIVMFLSSAVPTLSLAAEPQVAPSADASSTSANALSASTGASSASADSSSPAETRELSVVGRETTDADWGRLHLRRALFYLSRQDLLGAVTEAERCLLDPVVFPEADRAACLLAWGYERMGDDEGLAGLAARVRSWTLSSESADWVLEADARRRLRVGPGRDGADREPLRDKRAVATQSYEEFARILATAAAGDSLGFVRDLEQWILDHPDHLLATNAELRLGSAALDREAFDEAAAHFGRAAGGLAKRRAAVGELRTPGSLDQIWSDWEEGSGWSPLHVLHVSEGSVVSDLEGWMPSLVSDSGREVVELPARSLWEATGPAPLSRLVPHAAPDSLRHVSSLESAARSAFTERERARWRLRQARWELDRRREFLERGRLAAAEEAAALRSLAGEIRELEEDLNRILAQIDEVTEAEIDRIERRTERIRARAENSLLGIGAYRQFYEDGPDADRRSPAPESYPTTDLLLDRSESHGAALALGAEQFGNVMPDRIRRSREEIWKPAFRDGIAALALRVAGLVERAEGSERSIASRIDDLDPGDLLASLHEEVRLWDSEVAERVEVWVDARRRVVDSAAQLEIARLDSLSEATDYTVALASYELAIRGRLDADVARTNWETFLDRHPHALTRADGIYRLADLELTLEKQRFQEQMAAYLALQDGERSRTVVPILESGRALELYEEIVELHPSFAHLDAALYHVGVLRADDGDDRGMVALAHLLEEFPESRFRQEAELRMADYRFDQGRLDEAVELYERAAEGGDLGLAVIARYKLGWSHYRSDRFGPAAEAFARVLDLYDDGAEAPVPTDLRGESTDYLIHALSRGGGGKTAAELFDRLGPREYESDVFAAVGSLLRNYSLFPEAAESDRLWLERYPNDARALLIAGGLIGTYEAGERPELARAARLELAERFLPGTTWSEANGTDSLRIAAQKFSRNALHDVALFHHHRARARDGDPGIDRDPSQVEAGGQSVPGIGSVVDARSGGTEEWERALSLYDRILELWPDDPDGPRIHYQIGEAAARSGKRARAHAAFLTASRAEGEPFALDAAWQSLAVLDAWYEAAPTDSLARALLEESDAYLERNPFDPRNPDLAWRQAGISFAREWDEDAADRYGTFAQRFPSDPRSPRALALRGDVYYRVEEFASAAEAYLDAERFARSAGQDSLASELAGLVPHSYYLHAESLSGVPSAQAFERLALGWPQFDQAENSLYRAGIGFVDSGEILGATRCFEELLRRHPSGEYARDAHLRLASSLEDAGREIDAARAFERFSVAFPHDTESGPALLHSADLWRTAGNDPAAEATERSYVERFPEDRVTAAAVFHRQAERDLDRLGEIDAYANGLRPGGIASLLVPDSDLDRYLALANADSSLADPVLLARVDFLRAESVRDDFDSIRLTQPLAESLARKKASLEAVVGAYGTVVRRGVSPFSQAATFRIGECLIGFGDRLRESERPTDLSGDDLLAYDEVLEEQSWGFYEQGEDTWAELLQRIDPGLDDEGRWLERTQSSLWPRVAERFIHLAETDHPVVAAVRPEEESR